MWDHVWDNKGVWQLEAIKILKDRGNKADGRENVRIRKNLRTIQVRGLCKHINPQSIN